MHAVVQLPLAIWVGYGIFSPTCLTNIFTVENVLRHPVEVRREEFLPYGLLDWLEVLPEFLGGALHKGPLMLKRLMQAHV